MPDRLFRKASIVTLAILGATVLHRVTPAGPHAWHWAHLVARELYFLPLILAAAWFSWRGAVVATAAVSVTYLGHVLIDWRGSPMIQAEQAASLATFWLVSLVSSVLFGRIRASFAEVRLAHEETLTALASSLELRERYTAGHSERVRSYTLLLAERLGITDGRTLSEFAVGALLHDVGKIGIPDAVLLKGAALGPEEWGVMRSHPDLGASLVGKVRSLDAVRELVHSHHERFDGSGYPRGLKGEQIPLGARLFAVADTLDAMTTTRSYRPAMTYEEAVEVVKEGSGKQFDPRVVEAFLSIPFDS
jgi:response regulator RpfG family c-di-GMP phosphodiesterase